MNMKSWKVMMKGWSHPVVKNKDGIESLKSKKNWSKEKNELASSNSQVLDALLHGVDKDDLKRLTICTMTKDAWDILKTNYEGDESYVKELVDFVTTLTGRCNYMIEYNSYVELLLSL